MHTTLVDSAVHRRDRIRQHTRPSVRTRIDDSTRSQLLRYEAADARVIADRLEELDREWDTDRTIELEASVTGLLGVALGAFVRSGFLVIPAVVGGALLMHAVTGRYPLMPVLRRMGLRTSREIARERYALKALRGDFQGLTGSTHGSTGHPSSDDYSRRA